MRFRRPPTASAGRRLPLRFLTSSGISVLRTARRGIAIYRAATPSSLLWVAGLVTGLAAAIAHASGYNEYVVAAITAAAFVIAHLAIKHPDASGTCVTLGIWSVGTPWLASIYAKGSLSDVGGMFLTVCATGVLVALIAHRTSRRRAWVTTLLALIAFSVPGPLLMLAAPSSGVLLGWALTAAVLALRAGGWAWAVDTWETLRERIHAHRAAPHTPDIGTTGESQAEFGPRWADGQLAENRTALLLGDLNGRTTVLNHLDLPGRDEPLPHLTIGPGGVIAITSLALPGAVNEDPEQGLVHRQQSLAHQFAVAAAQRATVAAELGLRRQEVRVLVVVHDATLPESRMHVALSDDVGARLDTLTVLSPDELLGQVDPGIEMLSPRKATRLVRRARHRLAPYPRRGLPVTPSAVPDLPLATHLSILDSDGHPKRIVAPSDWRRPELDPPATYRPDIRFGQRVNIYTPTATHTDLRIAGPAYTTEGNSIVVPVCTEVDWRKAQASGKSPRAYPWPVNLLDVVDLEDDD